MRRAVILAAAAALGAALAAPPAAAEPGLVGRWLTGPGPSGGRAVVEIAPCGAAFCGRIVALVDGGDPARLGIELVRGLRPLPPERLAAGEILFPRLGRWFAAVVDYSTADRLAVSGCLAPGLFCRTQAWTRVAPEG